MTRLFVFLVLGVCVIRPTRAPGQVPLEPRTVAVEWNNSIPFFSQPFGVNEAKVKNQWSAGQLANWLNNEYPYWRFVPGDSTATTRLSVSFSTDQFSVHPFEVRTRITRLVAK